MADTLDTIDPLALDDLIVAELMNAHPETVPVFVGRRMACPGCVMAPFMTVTEAAKEYGFQPADLVHDLEEAIAKGPRKQLSI